MTQNNTTLSLPSFPALHEPDLIYRLMRISDQIIPFDEPDGATYIFTLQAKYAFIGLSFFALYARPELPPLYSIEEILKDRSEINFALIYYQSREDATSDIIQAMEHIASRSPEGQSVRTHASNSFETRAAQFRTTMMNLKTITLICFGLSAAFMISAYLSALCFAFYAGLNPDHILPWSNIYHLKFSDDNGKLVMLGGFAVPFMAALYLIITSLIKAPFLKSRWAKLADLKNAGLLEKTGLVFGKFKGKYLINDDPTHTIVIAPPRSGKGVGIAVPNMLSWDGSLICLDIKQENYRKTAGARKEYGQEVYMWAPMADDVKSNRYNPLDMVSSDPTSGSRIFR